MQRVAVISDTHIPNRATNIPASARDRIQDADHVIHAGDFTTASVLANVESLAGGNLTAISGNMDSTDLGLPSVDSCTIENVTFVVTHGTGSPQGYEDRVATIVQETTDESAVGVAGHTHEVLDTTINGIRLLNPGSVTGAAPANEATMMTVTVDGNDITVTVHQDT